MPLATTPKEKLHEARSKMITTSFFWGQLAFNLKFTESTKHKTLSTNGSNLWFNPEWVEKQDLNDLTGFMAYATVKCVLQHPYRMQSLSHIDADLVQLASSKVSTALVKEAGYQLPFDCPELEADEVNLSFEQVAQLLQAKRDLEKQNQQQNNSNNSQQTDGASDDDNEEGSEESESGTGSSNSDGEGEQESESESSEDENSESGESEENEEVESSTGTISAADEDSEEEASEVGEESEEKMTSTDWRIAVEQAVAVANKAGTLGGNAEQAINTSKEAKTSFRDHLKRFLSHSKPSKLTWNRLNKRLYALGIAQPGKRKQNMPKVAICVDTSSSVWWQPKLPQTFAQIVSDVLSEMKPERIDVYYADTAVQRIETFEPGQDVEIHNIGGGGTHFGPALQTITDNSIDENYCCVLYLTDMDNYGESQLTEPELPVLWVYPEWTPKSLHKPFGEHVSLSAVEI